MGHIIQLNGDPHEQAQRLLPWYVNNTLDPSERAVVEAHLAECAACRAELAMDQAFCIKAANPALDVEQGWAALKLDMKERRKPRIAPWRAPALLRRPIPLGWALSGQAAMLALMVGAVWIAQPAQPAYRALSAPRVTEPGNIVIVFRPDMTERALRGILTDTGARLVDGPTSTNAYMLHVDPRQRDAIVTRLRSESEVVLAEPIDSGARE